MLIPATNLKPQPRGVQPLLLPTHSSPLECALAKNPPATPLEYALTKLLDLKSPGMNTYKKGVGGPPPLPPLPSVLPASLLPCLSFSGSPISTARGDLHNWAQRRRKPALDARAEPAILSVCPPCGGQVACRPERSGRSEVGYGYRIESSRASRVPTLSGDPALDAGFFVFALSKARARHGAGRRSGGIATHGAVRRGSVRLRVQGRSTPPGAGKDAL